MSHQPAFSQKTSGDETLLKRVKREQLVDLCEQYQLPTEGTKPDLLARLRQYAADQVEAERKRKMERVRKVEDGIGADSKERYELVEGMVDEEDDEEDFFFFHAPETVVPQNENSSTTSKKKDVTPPITSASLTSPPPPMEPNADGERVVTVYSTTDQNDMTGVAAAQPGSIGSLDSLAGDGGGSLEPQPWERVETTDSRVLDEARERVGELVETLLAMTGLPAFLQDESAAPVSIGFNPSDVPTAVLTASSKSLRAGRGSVLQDVLRRYEMQAIGQDGMFGDDIQKGGGHYREVTKVRAFLEGYRKAEVRRLARETTALLLDKLILEGIEGLDMTLATMTRTNDDTGNQGGELNDSLLDFLNDVIRQQEKKVDQLVADRLDGVTVVTKESVDPVTNLWNVTVNEDGERIESIDPNDPRVREVLEEEARREMTAMEYRQTELVESGSSAIPETAPEKLLLLLTLLRERIKAEAAFSVDEKGRNLRLLAYCMRLMTEKEQEDLILKELGGSLDVRGCGWIGGFECSSRSHFFSSAIGFVHRACFQLDRVRREHLASAATRKEAIECSTPPQHP